MFFIYFSLKIKKKWSQQEALKLVHKKKKKKIKKKKGKKEKIKEKGKTTTTQELFGQRKIKPVGWSLVGFTNFRRKSFAQLFENSTLIINYKVIISLHRSTQNRVTNVTLPLNKYSNKRVSQMIYFNKVYLMFITASYKTGTIYIAGTHR